MLKTALQTFLIDNDGCFYPFGSEEQRLQDRPIHTNQSKGLKNSDSIQTQKRQESKVKWIPSGETVQVAGRMIGGLVYVTDSNPSELATGEDFGACINTTLPVANVRKKYSIQRHNYCERYIEFSPDLRALYLDWLHNGRMDKDYDLECLMLYFSGLERRFMFDDSTLSEKKKILIEVKRLISVYGDSPDTEYSLSTFVDLATTLISPNECVPVIGEDTKKFSLSVEVGLGRAVLQRENLTADWALSWYLCTPALKKNKAIYECFQEFTLVFRQLFQEKYPNGLPVIGSTYDLLVEYHSTSGDDIFRKFIFRTTTGQTVPDVVSLETPLSLINEIAKASYRKLSNYVKFLQKNPKIKGKSEALALLPLELRQICSPDRLESLNIWAEEIMDRKSGVVELEKFISVAGHARGYKPTPTEFMNAADTLALIGIGVCQDPRYSLKLSPFENFVTLFSMEPSTDLKNEVREEYTTMNLALHAGLYVAVIRGVYEYEISKTFRDILEKFIESNKQLTTNEQTRLLANISAFLVSPPTFEILTKPLRKLSIEVINTIQSIVLAIASKSLIWSSDVVDRVKEIYARMGLAQKQVLIDLLEDKKRFNANLKKVSETENSSKKPLTSGEIETNKDSEKWPWEEAYNYLDDFDSVMEIDEGYEKDGIEWIPKGETTTVAGLRLNGMVYVSRDGLPKEKDFDFQRLSVIYSKLPVAKTGSDVKSRELGAWSGYSGISSRSRRTYLEFLSTQRNDPSYNIGFMFIYFFGLEHRFFTKKTKKKEKKEILAEVIRLRNCFCGKDTVEPELERFIEVAQLELDCLGSDPVYKSFGFELPLAVAIELGKRVDRRKNITSEWGLSWFLCHPNRKLRTSAERCEKEFQQLFQIIFNHRFPDGIKVKKPRDKLEVCYESASEEFIIDIPAKNEDGKPISDVNGLDQPLGLLQSIADECMSKLRKLSQFIGGKPQSRNKLITLAYMPTCLRKVFCLEDLDKQKKWLSKSVGKNGVKLEEMLEYVYGEKPKKLTKKMLVDVADSLAPVGFGFAPDLNFIRGLPELDDQVFLFRSEPENFDIRDREVYTTAIVELGAGAFVAYAFETISPKDRSILEKLIEANVTLTECERNRLRANLEWLQGHAPTINFFRKSLREPASDKLKANIRKVVISIALTDGVVHREEISRIEKIYKLLGLDQGEVYSDLHAGVVVNEPITVRQALPGSKGEKIPQKIKQPSSVVLDRTKIEELVQQGDQVREILGEEFSGGAREVVEESLDNKEADDVFGSLEESDKKLLLDLIEKETWSEEEVEILARKHQVTWLASLEEINEWARVQYDEILVEEYDGYEIDSSIVQKLKKHLEE